MVNIALDRFGTETQLRNSAENSAPPVERAGQADEAVLLVD
jgi:hypothetical protein